MRTAPLRFIFLMSLGIMASTPSFGQLAIQRDTISMICQDNTGLRKSNTTTVYTSQLEFEAADFSARNGDTCMPLANIDFEKYSLVGFRFTGSNCDTQIERANILKQNTAYVIQFVTNPSACRDLHDRIAWFIIDKPEPGTSVSVERVPR